MEGMKDKAWAAALKRAVNRESAGKGSAKWLDVIAERVCVDAAGGDNSSFREIGDRLDGKPAQALKVSGDEENPLAVSIIERTIVDPKNTNS